MNIRQKMWRVLRGLLTVFLAVNIYALALRVLPVPGTILMIQRSLSGEDIKRDWTTLSDISPYMVQAVMAGEDGRFCEHDGIDWKAIEQAMNDNKTRARQRGGSTVTQQTAKNVFFWNGGGLFRKAGEAWFASLIDFTWGKTRVMEVYLNVAEWGDGIFGVEAAAQARFGKTAKALTKREASLLAAVLPSPNKWRLDPPTDYVAGRAAVLQKRMSVIRTSHYAKCVNGQKQEATPKRKISDPLPKSVQPLAKDVPLVEESIPDIAEPEAILSDEEDNESPIEPPLSLEKVLERAEESLEENVGDLEETPDP